MDKSELNRRAWDAIGTNVASPYIGLPGYRAALDGFMNKLPPDAAVLDLGCGPGMAVTQLLAGRFRLLGIDFSETMIEAARQNVQRASFQQMGMTDLPFNSEFDGIVASYSLTSLDEPAFQIVADKICRALKPGGLCFIAVGEGTGAGIVSIAGQQMYARAYRVADMLSAFAALSVLDVRRDEVTTEMYGTEHSMAIVMVKPR
jgi:SAM-dependent methyltransferase